MVLSHFSSSYGKNKPRSSSGGFETSCYLSKGLGRSGWDRIWTLMKFHCLTNREVDGTSLPIDHSIVANSVSVTICLFCPLQHSNLGLVAPFQQRSPKPSASRPSRRTRNNQALPPLTYYAQSSRSRLTRNACAILKT